eukprot:CAMPEP_0118944512 /NCGR_PEP_ID=MMETSP1169-20130426/40441_1 /TAXON_ID=36882 /ORGANISM="Pyramimonas obovata, Strain CCMP722" /LENGTH=101 /DNA_ID=CAMNT_0006890011 /DNA_START=166 /DNA_END=468 /DNA_ORIENTATION=-
MALCGAGRRFLSGLRVGGASGRGDVFASRVKSSLAANCTVPATRLMSHASSETPDYDIVVVGAGLVGAAFTCALKLSPLTSGLKVALLDRVPLSPPLEPRP